MLRAPLSLLVLVCACSTASTVTEDSQTPAAGASSYTAAGAEHTALAPELTAIARSEGTIDKINLRLDADGKVVKQSVYHHDETAVPAAVRDLAKERFGDAPIRSYETEVYADLGLVFEVEVDQDGSGCELAATEDGTELYTECRVDPATLSDAIKASIEKTAPGGKILEAESKSGPSVDDETTVEVETGDRELYIRMKADGTVIQVLRRVPAVIEVPL
ncbi:MAG: hypothetical protein AAF799_43250 [Myxococcota bacterium]